MGAWRWKTTEIILRQIDEHRRADDREAGVVLYNVESRGSRYRESWRSLMTIMNSAVKMNTGSVDVRILDSVVWMIAHSLITMPTNCVWQNSDAYLTASRAVPRP